MACRALDLAKAMHRRRGSGASKPTMQTK